MKKLHELPFVSVVVPAYNEERYLGQCLESVLAQTYPSARMEVLVVDNGSTDATPRIATTLLEMRGRGKTLHKIGGTIASVRNFGWRHAQGSFLAFLDGDSVVEPEWLETGMNLLLNDHGISCVGFGVAQPFREDSWVERVWFPISSSGKQKGTREVQWLSSFNLLLRRDFFEQIGGFDESLVTCEDADLGKRLSQVSRLLFSDACRVRHLGTVKSLGEFMGKEFWRGQNSLRLFLKGVNRSSEALSVFVPAGYLLLTAIWVGLALLAPFVDGVVFLWGASSTPILLMPLMMALRAGIRAPGVLLSTTALYFFYLLARGAAIVCYRP